MRKKTETFAEFCQHADVKEKLFYNLWNHCDVSQNHSSLSRFFDDLHTCQHIPPQHLNNLQKLCTNLIKNTDIDDPHIISINQFLDEVWKAFANDFLQFDIRKQKYVITDWFSVFLQELKETKSNELRQLEEKLREQANKMDPFLTNNYNKYQSKIDGISSLFVLLGSSDENLIESVFTGYLHGFVIPANLSIVKDQTKFLTIKQTLVGTIEKADFKSKQPFNNMHPEINKLFIEQKRHTHEFTVSSRKMRTHLVKPKKTSYQKCLQNHVVLIAGGAAAVGILFAGSIALIYIFTPAFTAIAVIHTLLHLTSAKITVLTVGEIGIVTGLLGSLETCHRYDELKNNPKKSKASKDQESRTPRYRYVPSTPRKERKPYNEMGQFERFITQKIDSLRGEVRIPVHKKRSSIPNAH